MHSSSHIGQTPHGHLSAISLLTQLESLTPPLGTGTPDRLAIACASRSIGSEEWLCGCRLRRLFQHARGLGQQATRALQSAAVGELARLHTMMDHEDWTICVAFCVENLSVPAVLALLDIECAPAASLERVRDALAELVYHGRPIGKRASSIANA